MRLSIHCHHALSINKVKQVSKAIIAVRGNHLTATENHGIYTVLPTVHFLATLLVHVVSVVIRERS